MEDLCKALGIKIVEANDRLTAELAIPGDLKKNPIRLNVEFAQEESSYTIRFTDPMIGALGIEISMSSSDNELSIEILLNTLVLKRSGSLLKVLGNSMVKDLIDYVSRLQ